MVREQAEEKKEVRKGMRLGKYELGRTLGEGNFGKVKFAKDTVSGQPFAVKIIDKSRIADLNFSLQIKREIRTLKMLKHPNIVRLHEVILCIISVILVLLYIWVKRVEDVYYFGHLRVLASKTKINMVMELVTGGELFDKIICKGDPPIPRWLSPGARTMIKKMLDPNPVTRITVAGIKASEWFKHEYTPSVPDDDDDEEDIDTDDDAFSVQDVGSEDGKGSDSPTIINAFQLIGMSSFLDLSGFFEQENVSERRIRFTSNSSAKDLLEKIENSVTEMGFSVQKKNAKLKVKQEEHNQKGQVGLSVTAEVFEIKPSLNVVELRKSYGDSSLYRQLYERLLKEVGTSSPEQELVT
ncbi:hypothetical protein HID58_019320 [Brassica napus]|uniref:non-specific serine/threonine protein kinase n=1 Tax=Brassica napus TaxID=3708 RepID=A0ABQ8DCF7_BRANA|nr:hypothetical protein HID58_019320 [Brassica napus]